MPKAIVYNSLSDPWRRALQMTTLMSNSLQVIAVRTQKIVEASANPLKGDYAELNRMIPEKADAFSEAAASLSSDFLAVQTEIMASWIEILGLALNPVLPTKDKAWKIANRSSAIAGSVLRAADKAMIPIEKKARANAKRLK